MATVNEYTLKLNFGTDLRGLATVPVSRARSDIDDASVSGAMERVILTGIVETKNGRPVSKDSAELVTTTTEDIAV